MEFRSSGCWGRGKGCGSVGRQGWVVCVIGRGRGRDGAKLGGEVEVCGLDALCDSGLALISDPDSIVTRTFTRLLGLTVPDE